MAELLLLALPFAPLTAAGAVVALPRLGRGHAALLTSCGAGLALLFALLLAGSSPKINSLWLETAGFSLTIGLQIDGLSWLMAMLVSGIGLVVSLYASGYMAPDPDQRRFFSTYSFFLSAMLTLVLADSFLLLFAAWEAVGVASYLLIGFWYDKESARRAALRAFLMTRFADLGLLLGWLWALQLTGSTDFQVLIKAVNTGVLSSATLTILAVLFLAAAIGKSGQLPLTTWLPDAMVGPTPVSALIHSATMVAAGVYLLLRMFPLIATAPLGLPLVLAVGAVTALAAAFIAAVQNDLKRVLAWSTASQLGEMMMAIGLGGAFSAAFHLATHAAFKSTLFLAAGAIDHQAGSRDLFRLGGLARKMPVTALVYGSAALALAGLPPLSGYWSEEAILGAAVHRHAGFGVLLIVLIFLAGIYVSRAGAAAFLRWPKNSAPDARDPQAGMQTSMILLAVPVLGLGWLLSLHLESVLPFSPTGELAWTWRVAAVGASLAGLSLGIWQVRQYGPVPAFGSLANTIEKGLYRLTEWPVRAAVAAANELDMTERWLDLRAHATARIFIGAAQGVGKSEHWLEVGAIKLTRAPRSAAAMIHENERWLDRAANDTGIAAMRMGAATDTTERRGFSLYTDYIAASVARAGGRVKSLQSGKLYFYTLAIFVWVLVFGLFGFLVPS